jgi:hypothetical protein
MAGIQVGSEFLLTLIGQLIPSLSSELKSQGAILILDQLSIEIQKALSLVLKSQVDGIG